MDNKTRIFEFLYRNHGSGHNINQIARLVNISVGSSFKILKELQKNGYVAAKQEKNAILYYINLNEKTRNLFYKLTLDSNKKDKKKTKIICTIGPSSNDPKIIRKLADAGMDCARINTSHCNEGLALNIIYNIRKVSLDIPILLDIPGPKIRLNNLTRPINVKTGKIINFTFDKSKNNELYLDTELHRSVKKGHKILIDDGKIELLVLKSKRNSLSCKALNDGIITKNKGLNFPDSFVDYKGIPEKDRFWVKFAIKNDIDFIGTSFVRSVSDIKKLNSLLGYGSLSDVVGDKIKVIAKIETKEAVKNYREIIKESYGVMIDRGDLASETRFELLPRLQKRIIDECNRQGKPVIIATQMLDSMVASSQPTKAEISDIANSVLDGASCLMLSAETASGKYPVESVRTMSKIAKEVEDDIENKELEDTNHLTFTDCIVNAISKIDGLIDIDSIVVITSGGYTARMLASKKLRPKIVAITTKKKILRQMHILWGVVPIIIEGSIDNITNKEKEKAILAALEQGIITKTNQIILTGSVFHFKSKRTNMLEMHKVNEFLDFVKKNE